MKVKITLDDDEKKDIISALRMGEEYFESDVRNALNKVLDKVPEKVTHELRMLKKDLDKEINETRKLERINND